MNKKNSDTLNQQSTATNKTHNNRKSLKSPLKIELCLMELLNRGDTGLVELEAFRAYGETCLHSTISTLANDKCLTFKRQTESHVHQHRGKVYFTRYSLFDDNETQKAQLLLNNYQSKRGFGNVA